MSKKKHANIEVSVKIFFLYFQKNDANNIPNLQFHPLKMKLSSLFWPQIKEYYLNFLKMCVKLQLIDVLLNKNAFKFRFAIWSDTPKAKSYTYLTYLSVKKLNKYFFITRDMKLNLFPSLFFNLVGKGLFFVEDI